MKCIVLYCIVYVQLDFSAAFDTVGIIMHGILFQLKSIGGILFHLAYADDYTLLAVVCKPVDRHAVAFPFNKDFARIKE